MIRFRRHELGVRCYILGRRLHHGMAGLIAIAVGALLAFHDRADWPFLADRP